MRTASKILLATAATMMAMPALAGANTASGVRDGLAWEATSRIIGMTPTSSVALPNTGGGGNSLFFPSSNKSGVVALIMETSAGAFICSGSLMADRVSILTAAHCVSDGFGTADPIRTTAYFFTGNPNERTPFSPNAVAREVGKIIVNSGYTGEVIDENDIAVLRLKNGVFGVDAYELFDGDLQGEQFNVAGYGGRSTIGGAFGVDSRTGFLREGDNNYDYTWGNSQFGGFFTDRDGTGEGFFGFADYANSWVSDFDSGLATNDMSCRIAAAVGAAPGFGCGTGVGAREVGVAGGDSGGPQFIGGRIASVTSYGLSFGTGFGDCRAGLNSSCGEYSGYVPVNIHKDFIASAMAVPEPSSWAMLIAGFGLVGATARRRRSASVAA
jgi:hypothetical protein